MQRMPFARKEQPMMAERILSKTKLLRKLWILPALWITVSIAPAQTPPAPTAFKFDVASIRPSKADEHARSHIISSAHDGRFTVINVPLKMLLQFAFDLPESQIMGAPSFASEKFDIEARSDPAIDDLLSKLDSAQARLQKRLMIQALFADRFKLASHAETRQLPIFNLITAKNGPKLQQSKSNGKTYNYHRGMIDDQGVTLSVFAEHLALQVGRPIVDKTAVEGRYDITLKWTPENDTTTSEPTVSLFTAFEEQLGLKLESTKGPVQILVIDHLEKPSDN
jgi:uncharacterized protein (TIGR03435 family)